MRLTAVLLLTVLLPAAAWGGAVCSPAELGNVHVGEETARFVIDMDYPVLCRADATRALRDHVCKALSEFKREFQEDESLFRHKYEMFVRYKTWTAARGRLVSVKLHTMVYTGGAHPNNWPETWIFDMDTGRRLGLGDVFADPAEALAQIAPKVREDLRTTLGEMALDIMLDPGTAPTTENYSEFVLTDQGITFLFAPYRVAPYAAGEQAVSLSYEELAPLLAPALREMLR